MASSTKLSTVKPRTLVFVWPLAVGLFAAYGFFGPGHKNQFYGEPFDYGKALEPMLIYGGIGFTFATCLTVILYAVQRLRVKTATGFGAIAFVFLCSVMAAFLPPFVMACSGRYTGESAMAIIYVAAHTIGIGLAGFVLFDIAVLILHLRRCVP